VIYVMVADVAAHRVEAARRIRRQSPGGSAPALFSEAAARPWAGWRRSAAAGTRLVAGCASSSLTSLRREGAGVSLQVIFASNQPTPGRGRASAARR
jgi:hypothetical protein